jgi:hypothetical protein
MPAAKDRSQLESSFFSLTDRFAAAASQLLLRAGPQESGFAMRAIKNTGYRATSDSGQTRKKPDEW